MKTFQVMVTNYLNCPHQEFNYDFGGGCEKEPTKSISACKRIFEKNKNEITDTYPAWIESQKAGEL